MVRTGHSFRIAVGSLDEVAGRINEIGWQTFPVADQCGTHSFVQMTKVAAAAGLRPVYGVRLAVVPELGQSKPITDNWTFLAKTDLRPLHDLIGKATANVGKVPSITYDQAAEADGLFKISGERVLLNQIDPEDEDFFIGLSPATSRGLVGDAKKIGHKFCASQNNLYPRQDDLEFYRIVIGFGSTTQTYPQWIVSDDEWLATTAGTDAIKADALDARDMILAGCVATIRTAELLVPDKPKTLRQLCLAGAKRVGVDLTKNDVYSNRLDRELAMIAEKKFEDYFHILADLIGWAKKRMIVGPARGSSCGSLVCYFLDITTIDPIAHDLMFERFIDVSRADLPDVDVDFSDVNRDKVFRYAEKKFGIDRVARLGNVNSFQAKSALSQVAKSLAIPRWRIDKVTASIIHRAMGDSRASQTIEDTLHATEVGKALLAEHPAIAIAARLEDHPAGASQHAAGVIVTQRPIADHVAVDRRTGVIMADKKDAETIGLLKIDALGLTQLSIFERTLELIGQPPRSGWLETIPIDDPAAFAVLNAKKFSGIFQFVGHAVQSLASALLRHDEFRTFYDIVALTALARPGPMGGGGSDAWIRRRTGREPVTYPHPLFEPYVRDTHGIVIYQEQVMAIGRDIGDLTWEEVSQLRRAMSHSYGQEFFDKFGDKWKAAAAAKGIDQGILDKTWMDLCNFGAMAFNKSHSVAYGMVSYWCCWLKAHYPVEFAAATLDAQSDPASQIAMLRELRDEGIDYVPVDAGLSADRWLPAEKNGRPTLIGPLTAIAGIGPAGVSDIMSSRKSGKPLKPSLIKKLEAAKTPIDSLYPVRDAVDRITGGDLAAIGIQSKPRSISDIIRNGQDIAGDVVAVVVVVRIDPTDENSLIRLQKRGGRKINGPSMALHMYGQDDTGEMFFKVHCRDYDAVGREIAERGRAGRVIYALKGRLYANPEFTMMWINRIKFIGELDD